MSELNINEAGFQFFIVTHVGKTIEDCRSEDEQIMWAYLEELKSRGVVKEFFYEAGHYLLGESTEESREIPRVTKDNKWEFSEFMSSTTYTPDFIIVWNQDHPETRYFIKSLLYPGPHYKNYFYVNKNPVHTHYSIIDVKPPAEADMCASRVFGLTQRFMWESIHKYVQKVVVRNAARALIHRTFVPDPYRVSPKTGKPYSFAGRKALSYEEFVEEKKAYYEKYKI